MTEETKPQTSFLVEAQMLANRQILLTGGLGCSGPAAQMV
jgi:hypothetical protein